VATRSPLDMDYLPGDLELDTALVNVVSVAIRELR
jgi:hypothetical protein